MPTARLPDDWCRRLGDALLDGRFLEDPALWAPHRIVCPSCDARVRGLLRLRALIEGARSGLSGAATISADAPPKVILARVTERMRHHRSRRRIQWMAGIGIIVGVGATQFLREPRRGDTSGEVVTGSTARRLLDQIVKPDGTMDVRRVASDSQFESACRAALSSAIPTDRQVAFMILALGQRPLSADLIAQLLRDARPHLDRPLEVAAQGLTGGSLASALEQGRTATLVTVLGSLPGVLASGGDWVAPEVIEPYLHDASAEVRKSTIVALGFHPKYQPTDALWTVLRSDPSVEVRSAAAVLLVRGAGAERVAEHFSKTRDYVAEEFVATTIGFGRHAQVLTYRRVADPGTPVRLGLRHAMRLLRAQLLFDRSVLVARALADTTHENDDLLSDCAAAGNWVDLRLALQVRWRASPSGYARERVAAGLATWDARSNDRSRYALAIELLERDMNRSAVDAALALRDAGDHATSLRAAAILDSWERRSRSQVIPSKE